MTREEQTLPTERDKQIEEASVEYSMSTRPQAIGGDAFSDLVYKRNINPSFIAGARWSDAHPNIVWHDSNKEQPAPGSRVLVLGVDGSIDVLVNVLEVYKDRKWLYLDFLLSKIEK